MYIPHRLFSLDHTQRFDRVEHQYNIDPQAPVAQKVADEVVFRRFGGEGVEFFFNRTSLTPPPLDF